MQNGKRLQELKFSGPSSLVAMRVTNLERQMKIQFYKDHEIVGEEFTYSMSEEVFLIARASFGGQRITLLDLEDI